MKVLFSVLLLAAMGAPALAGSDADLEDCARRSDASLCMNKVLLRAIEEGRRPGGPGHGGPGGPGGPGPGGPGGVVGLVRFYRDDGKCNSPVIGQVLLTMSAEFNRTACARSTASDSVWGFSVEMYGTTSCYDITDTYASDACRTAVSRAGLPI